MLWSIFSLYWGFLLEFGIVRHFGSERSSLFGSCGFGGIQPSPYSIVACITWIGSGKLEYLWWLLFASKSLLLWIFLWCTVYEPRLHSVLDSGSYPPFSVLSFLIAFTVHTPRLTHHSILRYVFASLYDLATVTVRSAWRNRTAISNRPYGLL